MTPFLQLRLWWRRSPGSTRLATTLALVIVAALIGWAVRPTGPGSSLVGAGTQAGEPRSSTGGEVTSPAELSDAVVSTSLPGGPDAQEGNAAVVTGDAGRAAPVAARSGGRAGIGGTGGNRCLAAPAGTPGVTDKTILVAVGILNLAGPIGNGTVGVASPDELRAMGQAIADDINARGGVQCRRLVLKFYEGNPINPDQQRANCLRMVQDRPLLVVDAGAFVYPQGAYACIPQQRVPLINSSMLLRSEITRFAPYIASVGVDAATEMRDVAFGLKELGFFDPAKGFRKLGLLLEDCSPELLNYFQSYLARAGIAGSQISKYVFPCPPGGFAPPNQMAQAVTQHRLDGVTHVIPLTGSGSFKTYTEIAEQQGFRPRYALNDYNGIIITSASSLQNNPNNFDRSIAITAGRFGQDTTPGIQQDPGTRRCQGIITKGGVTADYVFNKGGGVLCSLLWATEAALGHATSLGREGVIPGLLRAGTVQMAYPWPDTTYRPPDKVYGGDTWWHIQFHRECTCWRVLDPNRRPSFAE